MRLQYSTVHVPGKALVTAVALSRASLTKISQTNEQLII